MFWRQSSIWLTSLLFSFWLPCAKSSTAMSRSAKRVDSSPCDQLCTCAVSELYSDGDLRQRERVYRRGSASALIVPDAGDEERALVYTPGLCCFKLQVYATSGERPLVRASRW